MIFKRYFKRFQISAYKKAKNFCTQCYKRAGCGVRTVFSRYEIPSVVGFGQAVALLLWSDIVKRPRKGYFAFCL